MRDQKCQELLHLFEMSGSDQPPQNSMSYCQATRVVRPARIVGDIPEIYYTLFRKRRSSTRASVGAMGQGVIASQMWMAVGTRNRQ